MTIVLKAIYRFKSNPYPCPYLMKMVRTISANELDTSETLSTVPGTVAAGLGAGARAWEFPPLIIIINHL